MQRTLTNTPWLAMLWLCTASLVAGQEGKQEVRTDKKKQTHRVVTQVVTRTQSGDDAADQVDGNQPVTTKVFVVAAKEDDTDDQEGAGTKAKNQKIAGKIRVHGPDGKVHVLDLSKIGDKAGHKVLIFSGDDIREGHVELKDLDFEITEKDGLLQIHQENALAAGPRYFIGVHAEPVSPALRAHVEVPEGALIVEEVIDDSPAEEAGIRQYDIIVSINGKPVESVEGLVTRVQESEGKAIEVGLLRHGDDRRITLTPQKRDAKELAKVIREEVVARWSDNPLGEVQLRVLADGAARPLMIDTIRPGLVLDHQLSSPELKKRLAKLAGRNNQIQIINRMEARASSTERQHANSHKDEDGEQEIEIEVDTDDDMHQRVKKLEQELKKLRRALAEMKKSGR